VSVSVCPNRRTTVTEAEVRSRLAPVAPELRAASDAIERLRAQSAYHWVDMTLLMDPVKQVIDARASKEVVAA
jgi:hypothetical protein